VEALDVMIDLPLKFICLNNT